MRTLSLILFLFAGSTVAQAAGNYFDLDEELIIAKQLIDDERFVLAIDRLQDVVSNDAGNADAWNLLGYAARKQGDIEQSAEAYRLALDINPEHKDALEYQGELFLIQGNIGAAEENLLKLKVLCPDGCEQYEELLEAIAAHR